MNLGNRSIGHRRARAVPGNRRDCAGRKTLGRAAACLAPIDGGKVSLGAVHEGFARRPKRA